MKKVININFQGRVIPIEETAYDMLKQYVESLRIFFANEEGRDEIINDIEGRIAELFGESLKKGSTCITDADVNIIINSMGRPEDFEADEAKVHSALGAESKQQSYNTYEKRSEGRGRLYRNENDKLLGGVCSGLAIYLRVDPTIVRIIFAVITFGGFGTGFLLYLILWAVLPARTLNTNLKKRLYRNPEDRVVAGVAGGLSAYFNMPVWVPRLIFALPIVLGVITSIFQNAFFDFNPFPAIMFGSFGTSLFIIYVVLWIVIPEATSPTERLEMRGEKVDLNSIKNTFKEEMEGVRNRAEKFGSEFKEKATQWGEEVQDRTQQFTADASPVVRRTGNRLLNAIGIMFKAFFLFIAGIIVFAMLMALLGVMIGGVSVFPLKNFFLQGFWQNFFAWATLILFLGVPVIGFITWVIRRVIGVKSKSKYLGYTFAGLWVMGIIAGLILAGSLTNDFSAIAREKQDYNITQPVSGKMIVKVPEGNVKVYGRWFKMDGLLSMTDDSLYLNNVRLRIVKSADSFYHAYATKSSHAGTDVGAINNARQISYQVNQQDSMLYLSRGFALKRGTRFRNQGVIVTIQVPVGKRIQIDRSVSRKLNWFRVGHDNYKDDWDEDYEDNEQWYDNNVEYVMTVGGLERVDKSSSDRIEDAQEELNKTKDELKREIEEQQREIEEKKRQLEKTGDSTYRFKQTINGEEQKNDATEKAEEKVEPTAHVKNELFINPMTMPLQRFMN